jgi:hypothetical protein
MSITYNLETARLIINARRLLRWRLEPMLAEDWDPLERNRNEMQSRE